jgi:hypothetical protein
VRVSLSAEAQLGVCSKCGAGSHGLGRTMVIPFMVIVDGHAGETEALCQGCLFYPGGVKVEVPMENLAPGPAPRRGALRRAKQTSRRLEADLAEDLNEALGEGVVVTHPGSGNQPGAKGDLRGKNIVRVEEKHTKAASFSLKLDELQKIASECTGRERPVFVVDYLDPSTSKLQDRFAVIPIQDLKELLHAAGQHR